jgi:hypothetical protein
LVLRFGDLGHAPPIGYGISVTMVCLWPLNGNGAGADRQRSRLSTAFHRPSPGGPQAFPRFAPHIVDNQSPNHCILYPYLDKLRRR